MKRMSSLLCCLLALVMLLSACGTPSTDTEDGKENTGKDTLVVALGGEPTSLDPQGSSGMNDRRVVRQIYETLVVQDAEGNIQPGLATSWEWEDDTTIVFKLKEGVKWHNGETFTADDVYYSLNRAIESSYTKSYANRIDIENTKVIDPQTISVKLLSPYAPIMANLAFCALSIVNENAVTEGGENYGRNPVGTGPFKFVNWTAGDSIELEVFDEYWGAKPAYDKMVIRVITESANRAIELETGGVDIAYEIQANDISRLEENAGTVISRIPNYAVTFLGFNCDSSSPMSDPRMRQAVAYALNTEDISNAVYLGIGKPATGPIPSTVWGYTDEVPTYEQNIEKAKELLAQAGVETPKTLKLYTNDATDRTTIAEIVKNQLAQIGLEIEIHIIEQASFLATLEAKEDMYLLSWTTVTGDADFGMYTQYTSGSFGASGNRSYYYNPAVDEAPEIGQTSIDDQERLDAYKTAQQLIVEDAAAVYIWQGESVFGLSKNVNGFINLPSSLVSLAEITFAD